MFSPDMLERIKMVFTAMWNALQGKIEDPEMMLAQAHEELKDKLIAARMKLGEELAIETKLKEKLIALEAKKGSESEDVIKLKEDLLQHQFKLTKLRHQIEQLDNEEENASTKKQIILNQAFPFGGGNRTITDDLIFLLVSFLVISAAFGSFWAASGGFR